jgi:hypothetical protein
MPKLIVEKKDLKDKDWIVEGDMPFNEASCQHVAERNGMMTAIRVAIGLGTGSTIYIGMPHAQRRVTLEKGA